MGSNVRERDVADLDLLVGPLRAVSLRSAYGGGGQQCAAVRVQTLLNSLMLPISSVTSLGRTGYAWLSTSISPLSDMIAVADVGGLKG